MAILSILEFPDPRLRKVAQPVTHFDEHIVKLTQDMLETMYDAPGIGLAATQVNVHKRVIVIDTSEDKSQPLIIINPTVSTLDQQLESMQEGCLSVPGFYEEVSRPNHVILKAQNERGEPYELEAKGLLAVCIQHEIDHLDGKLMVDYISSLKRTRIRKKLEKKHRLDRQTS